MRFNHTFPQEITIIEKVNGYQHLVDHPGASTLTEILTRQAHAYDGKSVFEAPFCTAGDIDKLSFQELSRKAMSVARELEKFGNPDDRVLIIFDSGLEYIISFFGCLYARRIAVPVYPPKFYQQKDRLALIINDCAASLILCSKSAATDAQVLNCNLELLVLNDISENEIEQWQPPHVHKDQVAFIQYTSGSTGEPKGVILTHGNLLSNLAMIKEMFKVDEKSILVSWLPLYHDMGLIGGVLAPVYLGCTAHLIPSITVLRPLKWLKLIQDKKATITGGPNFSLDLCVDRVSEADVSKLDLSSLKMFFTGAEIVRASTIDRFNTKFASAGLSQNVLTPCYGMAEATLLLASGDPESSNVIVDVDSKLLAQRLVLPLPKSEATQGVVSVGKVPTGIKLKIINDANEECEIFKIGEIVVSGENVTRGYYSKDEQRDQNLFVKIYENSYFRTGDMGFLDADNNLFISGRKKEMIIVRGKNYFPQDIEVSIFKSCLELNESKAAIFSVEYLQNEVLVAIIEAPRNFEPALLLEIKAKSKRAALQDFSLPLHQVVFIRNGKIPRTTSGKIRRNEAKSMFLNNQFDVISVFDPEV